MHMMSVLSRVAGQWRTAVIGTWMVVEDSRHRHMMTVEDSRHRHVEDSRHRHMMMVNDVA